MTQNISRRTIAKGAAWSLPAVAVASAVPAMALSGVTVTCPSASDIKLQSSSGNPAVSFRAASDQYTNVDGNGTSGTVFSLTAGAWNIPSAARSDGKTATGYYMLPGSCGYMQCNPDTTTGPTMPGPEFTVTSVDGKTHKARVASYTPTGCSPQTAGAGLLETWHIHTDIPYYNGGDICQLIAERPANMIKSIQIPVTLIYLDGLTPIYNTSNSSCCYTLSITFQSGKGVCLATAPSSSFSWS